MSKKPTNQDHMARERRDPAANSALGLSLAESAAALASARVSAAASAAALGRKRKGDDLRSKPKTSTPPTPPTAMPSPAATLPVVAYDESGVPVILAHAQQQPSPANFSRGALEFSYELSQRTRHSSDETNLAAQGTMAEPQAREEPGICPGSMMNPYQQEPVTDQWAPSDQTFQFGPASGWGPHPTHFAPQMPSGEGFGSMRQQHDPLIYQLQENLNAAHQEIAAMRETISYLQYQNDALAAENATFAKTSHTEREITRGYREMVEEYRETLVRAGLLQLPTGYLPPQQEAPPALTRGTFTANPLNPGAARDIARK